MSHVFISYVREDSETVSRLADQLRARGANVWLDKDDLAVGVHWKVAIKRAIENGAFFVACFSESSGERDRTYMNTELDIAIEELSMRRSDRAWFLPVLLDPVEVPDRSIGGMGSLRDIHHVRMYADWDEAVSRLIAAIQPTAAARETEGRLRESDEPVPVEPDTAADEPEGARPEEIVGGHPPLTWNAPDTVQLREQAHKKSAWALAFHPDGGLLASAGADDTSVRLWRVPRLERHPADFQHEGAVRGMAFSPDGRSLATAGQDNAVRIWNLETAKERLCLLHDDHIDSYIFKPAMAFNKCGSLLATASLVGKLHVWDLVTGRELTCFGDIKHVEEIAFSPFDRLLATAGLDGTARLWDVDSGDELMNKQHAKGDIDNAIQQVAFSPDGRLWATVAKDGSSHVWEIESGTEVRELKRDEVARVVFSQARRLIASGCADQTVRVSEVDSGLELLRVEHPYEVRKFALSPDGALLATLSEDMSIRVCNMNEGEEPFVLNEQRAFDLAFSPDSRLLATAADNLRLWGGKGH